MFPEDSRVMRSPPIPHKMDLTNEEGVNGYNYLLIEEAKVVSCLLD